MKFKWLKSNRSIIKFLLMLFITSILVGIYLYLSKEKLIRESINTELIKMINNLDITRQNNILNHLLIMIVLSVLSLTIIGLPIILIYFLYEGVSIGFLLSSFINYSPIKGMLFGTIFIIISKIIYITILIYLLTNTLKYTKNFLKRLKMAKNELIINQVIKISFCTTITLINDIILYFIGNKIITIFKFIL
ncbi:stage II sporulation protein M [bacterium]|nr:stage II sporulation protein M [bacterium]MDY3756839.1 stage II sporulation protein M [Bacilli bacterium]